MASITEPQFSTERINYILVNQKVMDSLFNGGHPEGEVLDFFGYTDPLQLVLEEERYRAGLSTFNRTFCYFHLRDKQTNLYIGQCGFHSLAPLHQRGELFYSITHPLNRRRGLMNEALPEVMKFGFTELDLNRVEAITGPTNEASVSLLKKFGFVYEGLMREHYRVGEVIEDSLLFSILKKEWSFGL